MSLKDAEEFLDHAILDPIIRVKYLLAWHVDDIMNIAEHLGLTFTMEELNAASHENTKDWKFTNLKEPKTEQTPKWLDDIAYIFKDHQERYENQFQEWPQTNIDYNEKVQKQNLSEIDKLELYIYMRKSPLFLTLKNSLSFILRSDVTTRFKAEEFLDPMHRENPNYFRTKVNYLPSKLDRPAHPELLVWCFDEDDLNQRLHEMIVYIEQRPKPLITSVFLTTHWSWKPWLNVNEKIKILAEGGTDFWFIFFSVFGATVIKKLMLP